MRWPAGLLALVLLAGCGLVVDREPSMTYEEARQRIVGLVEDSLVTGLQGTPPPQVEPLFRDSPSCVDAWGALVVDEVQHGLEYNFPLDHLGEDPDAFVAAVERSWRERGFTVTPYPASGVPTVFAVVEGGFRLQVFVNHNTGMVYVGGTGPCVKAPSES